MITQELNQTSRANVVDFQTLNEMKAAGTDKNGRLIGQSGVFNIIEGAYSAIGPDSLVFTNYIKRLADGEVLANFNPIKFAKSDPAAGIKLISNEIKGYWEASSESVITIPNFEAFQFFIKARNHWEDEVVAKQHLEQAIRADPLFLDPYLYLMSLFDERTEAAQIQQVLDEIKIKWPNIGEREKILLDYYQALINGDNKRTYNLMIKDFENYNNDHFATTEYMIYAKELVNNPKKSIEIYEQDELRDSDLVNCNYCLERIKVAIISYTELGEIKKARDLIGIFPEELKVLKNYGFLIQHYANTKNFSQINAIIDRANVDSHIERTDVLHYVAARELLLNKETDVAQPFIDHVIQNIDTSNIYYDWAHYFNEDYTRALDGFIGKLDNDNYNQLELKSQIGVIEAKLGRPEKALAMIEDLGRNDHKYDFGFTSYYMARIWLQLGEEEKALDALELAVKNGVRFYYFNMWDGDIDLQSLRSNPRYQQITRPLGN